MKRSKNAHLKCTILSGQSVIGIIKNISAFNTVRMAGDFDNIAVMNQTINDSVGNDSVSEDIRPFRKRLIGCKDSRPELVSCSDELKEPESGVLVNREIADFIND